MLPLLPAPPGVRVNVSPAAAVPADRDTLSTSPLGAGGLGKAIAISAPEVALTEPEARTEPPLVRTSKLVAEVKAIANVWPKALDGTLTVPGGNAPLATGPPTVACTL